MVLLDSLRALGLCLFLGACTVAQTEDIGVSQQRWDSQNGNPTHATHSIMTELAIANLENIYPELRQYEKDLIRGVNLELHEIRRDSYEELRQEVQGTNWAANNPGVLWEKARLVYGGGFKDTAYFYVGVLLHYVQDMGVPAHAFHVFHQSTIGHRDNLEVLGFFDFHADFNTPATPDPDLENPVDYIEWSAQTARAHFNGTFPGATYTTEFFPQGYSEMSELQWSFLRRREADCTRGTFYALRSAALALPRSVNSPR